MEILNINLALEIVIIIGGLYLAFFKSYFTEKGKNLATFEDITGITTKIESVKEVFNTKIESIKSELQKNNITYQINLFELTKIRFQRIDNLYEDLVNLQKFTQVNMFYFKDDTDYQFKKNEFLKIYNIADKSRYKCNLYITEELKKKIIDVLNGAFSAYSSFVKLYNTDTRKFGDVDPFNISKQELMLKLNNENMDALTKLNGAVDKFPDLLKQLEDEFKKQVILKDIE